VNIYRKVKFSDWLRKSLLFIRRAPWVWAGYTLFVALVLCIGRISYALGIFAAVVSLFVGVGVAKYIDLKNSEDSVSLGWAIKKSLPLAIIMGLAIVICWFIFSALANILNGQADLISYFFFDWQYTPENLKRRDTRELAVWIYGYANITLVFTLLMLATFASWYSYPLMLFKDYSWSRAKEEGRQESAIQKDAYYKLLAFLLFEAILCAVITPLLTPVLYMLTSTFMFVTYKSCYEKT
jgi:hypothetical protein